MISVFGDPWNVFVALRLSYDLRWSPTLGGKGAPHGWTGDCAARDAFGGLSDALLAFVRGVDGTLPEGLNEAYCPMARKSWISAASSGARQSAAKG